MKMVYRVGYVGFLWAVLKIMGPFSFRIYSSTYYLGEPKWDPNFGNYPYHAAPPVTLNPCDLLLPMRLFL